jgi:hypothetical protein
MAAGGGGRVQTVKIVMVVSVLIAGLGSVPAADAQDSRPQPDIRMLLTQPTNRVAAPDSPPAPDLRELPQVKMDRLSDQPSPITVVVGDPRCYPGEDGMTDPRQLRNSRSRRPH